MNKYIGHRFAILDAQRLLEGVFLNVDVVRAVNQKVLVFRHLLELNVERVVVEQTRNAALGEIARRVAAKNELRLDVVRIQRDVDFAHQSQSKKESQSAETGTHSSPLPRVNGTGHFESILFLRAPAFGEVVQTSFGVHSKVSDTDGGQVQRKSENRWNRALDVHETARLRHIQNAAIDAVSTLRQIVPDFLNFACVRDEFGVERRLFAGVLPRLNQARQLMEREFFHDDVRQFVSNGVQSIVSEEKTHNVRLLVVIPREFVSEHFDETRNGYIVFQRLEIHREPFLKNEKSEKIKWPTNSTVYRSVKMACVVVTSQQTEIANGSEEEIDQLIYSSSTHANLEKPASIK